jgi:hypothetical protein
MPTSTKNLSFSLTSLEQQVFAEACKCPQGEMNTIPVDSHGDESILTDTFLNWQTTELDPPSNMSYTLLRKFLQSVKLRPNATTAAKQTKVLFNDGIDPVGGF